MILYFDCEVVDLCFRYFVVGAGAYFGKRAGVGGGNWAGVHAFRRFHVSAQVGLRKISLRDHTAPGMRFEINHYGIT